MSRLTRRERRGVRPQLKKQRGKVPPGKNNSTLSAQRSVMPQALRFIAYLRTTVNMEIIKKIASGFSFTEGPLWHPAGYLLFSDTIANQIWRMDRDGVTTVYLEKSGLTNECSDCSNMIGSNGLALHTDSSILVCQHGNHAIAAWKDGQLKSLVTHYNDRPFNSPNDIIVRSDGTVYFTDPPYGLKDEVANPSKFQPHAGVYKLKDGKITLISTEFQYPNGVCFSPDEKFLYVSSNYPEEPVIRRYELSADGDVISSSILANQNADGITCDQKGNILTCTNEGIVIFSPAGKRKVFVAMEESPANITHGEDSSEFYITARTSIYKIERDTYRMLIGWEPANLTLHRDA